MDRQSPLGEPPAVIEITEPPPHEEAQVFFNYQLLALNLRKCITKAQFFVDDIYTICLMLVPLALMIFVFGIVHGYLYMCAGMLIYTIQLALFFIGAMMRRYYLCIACNITAILWASLFFAYFIMSVWNIFRHNPKIISSELFLCLMLCGMMFCQIYMAICFKNLEQCIAFYGLGDYIINNSDADNILHAASIADKKRASTINGGINSRNKEKQIYNSNKKD